MSVSDDLDILARTIHGEARGELFEGAVAVGYVVANRVRLKIRGESIRECCLARSQFSAWNAGDANLRVVATVSLDSDPSFMRAVCAAAVVLSKALPDPTGGATDYHTIERPSDVGTWPPEWAQDYSPTTRIGGHQFYRRA